MIAPETKFFFDFSTTHRGIYSYDPIWRDTQNDITAENGLSMRLDPAGFDVSGRFGLRRRIFDRNSDSGAPLAGTEIFVGFDGS
jgi:hypothetical protein